MEEAAETTRVVYCARTHSWTESQDKIVSPIWYYLSQFHHWEKDARTYAILEIRVGTYKGGSQTAYFVDVEMCGQGVPSRQQGNVFTYTVLVHELLAFHSAEVRV